jgi:phosphoribosylamine--glycine ligase
LTVPGPELPLTLGVVDEFERHGLRVFGPTREAAQLEGSKAFTKDLLRRCQIPTGYFGSFTDLDEALQYVREVGAPIVVKADGLAAGKGVILCGTVKEAEDAVTDGRTVLPLASSQDHKRAGDGDTGPNTGGMGAYSPAPVVTTELHERIMREIMQPLVDGLRDRGIVYKGVLYAGLMIHDGVPKVLEFNARFGDPECQTLLIRLQSDLLDTLEAVVDERLESVSLRWDDRSSACVVLAAEGYPGNYEKGREIHGLESLRGWRNGVVFHAGTAQRNGAVVTNGGRVLGVTALGADIAAAVAEAYRAIEHIEWDGVYYRHDIGRRALERQ